MKTLVTGANGFIGSRFLTHTTPSKDLFLHVRRQNAADALMQAGFQTLVGEDGLAKLPSVDTIVHFAGKPGGSWKDCMESNILPTIEILRVMEKKQIPHLVFLSSGSVYGDTPNVIKEEESYNPTTAYGASKVAGEIIISDWVGHKRIASATVLRGNNIYGPGSDHGVVSLFLDRIRKNQQIEIDGDGSQIREPVYVDDVIELVNLVLANSPMGVVTYTLSGGEFFTLKSLIEHIPKALHVPAQFKVSGRPAQPPLSMRLDISKAEKELGWRPHTVFSDGLAKIIEAHV